MLPHLGMLLESIVVDCLPCLVVVFVKADKISMEVLEYTKMYDVYDVYGKYFVNGGEQTLSTPQSKTLLLTFDPEVCVNFPGLAVANSKLCARPL